MNLTTAELDVQAKIAAKRDAIARFHACCSRASRLLDQAATIATNAGLGDIPIAQARAASGIAGAMLHTIHGQPSAADFLRLRDDLELIATKVDPVYEAIGSEARGSTDTISDDEFKENFVGITAKAIDGQGSYILDRAAEAVVEECWRGQAAE